MALIQKTTTSANQSTKTVSLLETTGVYNALTNLGGYGASQTPLTKREISDILSGALYILQLSEVFSFEGLAIPTTGTVIYSETLTSGNAQTLAGGTIKSMNLSSLTDYKDAIYKLIYINWFDGDGDGVSPGSTSTTITVTNSDYLTNASFIKLTTNGENYIFDIVSISGTTIEINKPFTLFDDEVIYTVGYSSTSYFQNVHDINQCLHTDIAKSACSDCSCNKTKKEKLFTAVMNFIGIQPNIDRGNYPCAQEIIDSITIYCSKSGCNC